MHPDLLLTKTFIYDPYDVGFAQFKEEAESQEYAASTFTLNATDIKFRVAKVTPTKTGLFVTLWKRNAQGITCPHEASDAIDFIVISCRDKNKFGQFVFAKSVLVKEGIITTALKEGKRGFRVYPPWEMDLNKQALKTQKWQAEFFLEIKGGDSPDALRVKQLYSVNS